MTKEEIINRLDELAQERRTMTLTYERAVKINKEQAKSLVASLNDIKIGDKINHSRYGKITQGVIIDIGAEYFNFDPPKYSKKPLLVVSYLKKDGTPRVDSSRIYGDWSKAD